MKKITSIVLALVMVLSVMTVGIAGVSAEITTPGGNGESVITLTVNARNLRATVPSVLPIDVDSDNNVTVATNAKINNLSDGPIEVTNVSVESQNGWTIVPFSTDFTKVPVDTKQYGMTMYDDDVVDGVPVSLFDVIEGSSELPVRYEGNVAIQSNAINHLDIGHVVFTVAWSNGVRLGPNDITYNVENTGVQAYMNTAAYDAFDLSYTNWNNSFKSGVLGRPADGTLTVPTGASNIVIKNSDGSVFLSDTISGTEYAVTNLIPNKTYYYEVTDDSGNNIQSGAIYPTGQVRMINVGSSVVNMRDLGGWTADGGKLKYGSIYRSMELNGPSYGVSLSEKSVSLLKDVLHISDEIDLRGSSELNGISESALGNDVSWVNYPASMYAISRDIYTTSGTNYYVQAIRRVIQDLRNNKSVLIHCVEGADRSATVCALIEALCGASADGIDRDYELSNFFVSRSRNSASYRGFRLALQSADDITVQQGAVNWAIKAGMTFNEINELRSLLIDGTPSVITQDYLSSEKYDETVATLNSHPDWQTGELVSYSNDVLTTDFIACGPCAQFEISSDVALDSDSYSARIYFYDENKNFLTYCKSTANGVTFSSDKKSVSVLLPLAVQNNNIRYARVCAAYANTSNLSVKIK